ncbi:hypothetical protein QBZ16_001462 [Prototheca wickerhamii]|uniref:Phosphoglycerate mutase-like protein n=1 Tax=Prototheca wickerhamii TaxID=3111 RepID=A0AAD9MLP4_PROWI|nr:hypothetical protein QBZ16_001462 [Prototheca wickerhamii]
MSSSKKPKDRVEHFREYVTALNKQFVGWCTNQWARKPGMFWSSGMHDYLRHTAKIRREFQDILEDNSDAGAMGASPAHGLDQRPPKYEPQLSLMPISYTKVIHFIRHGEGFHNAGINTPDSHLTPKGWQQAHALAGHMRGCAPNNGVQLVVVSPLMRTLETAAGIFGVADPASAAVAASGAEDMSEDGAQPAVLMLAQSEQASMRVAHEQLFVPPGVSFVAHELCRERLGPSHCDQRRPVTQAAACFPGVDFSLIESDEDQLWAPGNVEAEAQVVHRGMKFLQWLVTRPETNIAVVTHSAFLWFTLTCFGNEYARPVRENLQRWYENAESRTLILSDAGGAGVPDVTWFPGGDKAPRADLV